MVKSKITKAVRELAVEAGCMGFLFGLLLGVLICHWFGD